MGAMAMLFPKLSLFLLYRRLFSPNRNTKRLIYYGIIVSLATYWTFIPLETYYCTPRGNQQWNAIEVSEKCSKIRPYTIVQGAINVLLDVYILYLPIPVVWKLQLSTPQKAGVLFVFMHGIMSVI